MSFAAKLYVSTDPRRSDRRAADVASTLRSRVGGPVDVRVIDISRHGFRCMTTADLREGDAVRIGLRGNGNGSAIVRWRRGAQIGGEFITPLTEAEMLAAISADVVVAVAKWARTGSVLLSTKATRPTYRSARLLTGLLAAALLADLLDGYLSRLF